MSISSGLYEYISTSLLNGGFVLVSSTIKNVCESEFGVRISRSLVIVNSLLLKLNL